MEADCSHGNAVTDKPFKAIAAAKISKSAAEGAKGPSLMSDVTTDAEQ